MPIQSDYRANHVRWILGINSASTSGSSCWMRLIKQHVLVAIASLSWMLSTALKLVQRGWDDLSLNRMRCWGSTLNCTLKPGSGNSIWMLKMKWNVNAHLSYVSGLHTRTHFCSHIYLNSPDQLTHTKGIHLDKQKLTQYSREASANTVQG
jgi:hypothetical protein